MTSDNQGCLNVFPLWMLMTFRVLFAAMVSLGGYAAFAQGPASGGVFVVGLLAVLGLLLHVLCRRCPYPRDLDTCLFFPFAVMRFVAPPRTGPMTGWDKAGTVLGMVALALLPLPWLLGNLTLLAIYVALGSAITLLSIWRTCPRCRHVECPFNRIPEVIGEKDAAPQE